MMLIIVCVLIILWDINTSIFASQIIAESFFQNASWIYFFSTFIASIIGEGTATYIIKKFSDIGLFRMGILLICLNIISQIIVINFCEERLIFIFLFLIGLSKNTVALILFKSTYLLPINRLYNKCILISSVFGSLLLRFKTIALFPILLIFGLVCIMLFIFMDISQNAIELEEKESSISFIKFIKTKKNIFIKLVLLYCAEGMFLRFLQLILSKIIIISSNISTYLFTLFFGQLTAHIISRRYNKTIVRLFFIISIAFISTIPFIIGHKVILCCTLFIIGYLFNQDMFRDSLFEDNDKSHFILLNQIKLFSIFIAVFIGSILIKINIYLIFLCICSILSVLVFI